MAGENAQSAILIPESSPPARDLSPELDISVGVEEQGEEDTVMGGIEAGADVEFLKILGVFGDLRLIDDSQLRIPVSEVSPNCAKLTSRMPVGS